MTAKSPELSSSETITQNGLASFEIFKFGPKRGVQKGSKKVGVYQLEGPAKGT